MLDTKPSKFKGYPLHKRVVPNATTRKWGIASCEVNQIPLVNCLHYGWNDQFLRKLSAGDTIGLVPCDGAAEAVFLQRLLGLLRAKNITGDKLDQAVRQAYINRTGIQDPSPNLAPTLLAEPLAKQIFEVITNYNKQANFGPDTEDQQANKERVAELEHKLKTQGIPLAASKKELGELLPAEAPSAPSMAPDQAAL